MVYTYDSKSYGRKAVRVRIPPSAQNYNKLLISTLIYENRGYWQYAIYGKNAGGSR